MRLDETDSEMLSVADSNDSPAGLFDPSANPCVSRQTKLDLVLSDILRALVCVTTACAGRRTSVKPRLRSSGLSTRSCNRN